MNSNDFELDNFKYKLSKTKQMQEYELLADFFFNINVANFLVKNNKNIKRILDKKDLKPTIYYKNIKDLKNSHIINVVKLSEKIGQQIGINKNEMAILIQGATLHDYGKILIPSRYIQKEGKLTKDEKGIVSLHAELGFELLRPLNFDERVINIVRNHHQYANKNHDILGQIVTIADIYSALTEKRVYKSMYSEEEALQKLKDYANSGLINRDILVALLEIQNTNNNEIIAA